MLPGELDGSRFLRALGRCGWHVARAKGSHRVLKNAAGRTLVLAFHDVVSRNTIRRTLREAGVSEEAFERQL